MQHSFPWAIARFCASLLLGTVLFAGCRTRPYLNSHIESVNTEYRQLEDYVYALEEENARLQQQIDLLKAGVPVKNAPATTGAPRTTAPRRPPVMNPQRSQPSTGEPGLEPP